MTIDYFANDYQLPTNDHCAQDFELETLNLKLK